MAITSPFDAGLLSFSREAVLRDWGIATRSRHASVLGRQEVLRGRGKFGIFGAGKESAQLAMAYAFKKGDVRAGYYRDQTFMMALGLLSVQQLFAQLYAHASIEAEPAFGGRAMTGHFATRMLDEQGRWLNQLETYNSSADLSPTAAQMPKLVGLGHASRLYREVPGLADAVPGFSDNGDEIGFGTIGNASCAEGLFWESVNAIGVLQAPVLLSIWDDGYGISVPNRFQMTKGDVSRVLEGFRRRGAGRPGLDLHTVRGWDYAQLCETYLRAADSVRRSHVPAILHVTELTQPQGHSTSGSHERYKSDERLAWEEEYDCLLKMREWIVAEGLATHDELDEIDGAEETAAKAARDRAWTEYCGELEQERTVYLEIVRSLHHDTGRQSFEDEAERLLRRSPVLRRDLLSSAQKLLVETVADEAPSRAVLLDWREKQLAASARRYGSDLYSEAEESALSVTEVAPTYPEDGGEQKSAFEILNAGFDDAFARVPELFALGEDVGQLGDVNQGLADLQAKYGEARVADTGIREATIVGQAIGMALRGLRPIAEIQYLDYIHYALQLLSDELATLRWRTAGGQKAPVILRTRGHRLEGIWHSGSPMGGILHLVRGMHVCVPRDATRAVGMYNTLLASDDPAIVVEVLNAYRKKEPLPTNLAEVRVPLGHPEILRTGSDVTIVTYGACCPLALEAAASLEAVGVDAEVIDVQTLLPFDRTGTIRSSLERTNRVVFLDEDVPGGASAFMMQQVLDRQGGYESLDGPPVCLSASEHRPPYGSDGDYFSKPSADSIFAAAYELVRESRPRDLPAFFD
ncbi:MAG: transketolase C-terminal domain-containing protein [Acidobacteriota bacterium]